MADLSKLKELVAQSCRVLGKLNLTKDEKSDLVAFLKTLTGTQPHVDVPQMYADAKAGKQGGKRK